eukprot:19353-Heterococcus_DN1.PRE.2
MTVVESSHKLLQLADTLLQSTASAPSLPADTFRCVIACAVRHRRLTALSHPKFLALLRAAPTYCKKQCR